MSIPLVVSPAYLPGVVIPMQRVGVRIVFCQQARDEQQVSSSRSAAAGQQQAAGEQQQQASSRQAAGKLQASCGQAARILEAEEMLC